MIFSAFSDGRFDLAGRRTICALGRSGVIGSAIKREGDGCSPIGVWPIRQLLYRLERIGTPSTRLLSRPIEADDGWCDAPKDPQYNRLVTYPYPSSAEQLCREDHVYDLIVVLGYNDEPVVPGAGSAIFLHLAREGFLPTEGCVALGLEDALELVGRARPGDSVAICGL